MWELPELPLALIMEEILEWEKKPGQEKDKEKEEKGEQTDTRNKDK